MRILCISLLLLVPVAVLAEPLGRLFSTPAQRSDLEHLRQTKKSVQDTDVRKPQMRAAVPSEVSSRPINLQGYVKRTDGHAGTVWINGQALQENSANDAVAVGKLPAAGNRVPIKIPDTGQRMTLKAGQVYDPENNRVSEARDHAAQGDTGRIGDASLE